MAFQNKNLLVLKKVVLPKTTTKKECSVELEGDVTKILSATTSVSLVSSEVVDGEINYTAELSTCVIYATSDFKIGSANSICEYSGRIENSLIKSGDKAIVSLMIADNNISFENGNVVSSLDIEESVELFSQKEVKNIDTDDDDVCVKNDMLKIEKMIGEGKGEVQTDEEIVARGDVKKIVSIEPSVCVKNAECENGVMTVQGETFTRLTYITSEDKFQTDFAVGSFKHEIEIDKVESGMIANCKANIKSKDCVAEVLESDKGTKISVKTVFSLDAYAFASEEVSVLEDAYSTDSELNLTSESFDMTKVCKSELLEGKIDGSLTLDENAPRIDKIIFSGGTIARVTNVYVSDNELTCEGIAKTTVVYLNDEENSLNSVEVEIPFVVNDKTDASETAVVCCDVSIYDTDVSVKKGREIFFDGKIKIMARVCESEVSATIVSMEKGEKFDDEECAMQYVIGKNGESLWDVSKRYKIRQEQLVSQNPDVVFPLIQDTGFILFYQKMM